jgi:putative phosphoribosyl transferase
MGRSMDFSAEPRPWLPFLDRHDAGTRLGRALFAPAWPGRDATGATPGGGGPRSAGFGDAVVLGLARGGVPVAAAVARDLRLPLGVLVVRKLGVPGSPEVAFGALATYQGATASVHLERTVRALARHGYDSGALEQVEGDERAELARRQALYAVGAQPPVAGRTVLLCDDGLATGATLRASVAAMRNAGAATVVACVPAAPAHGCRELAAVADRVVCLQPWPTFHAVSEAYLNFHQVGDGEVLALLGGGGPSLAATGEPGPLPWQ